MIAIWRETGTFKITEQRLVDQARVIRTKEWLTEVELGQIRRKTLTPRDGEENQEINDISVIEERIRDENGRMEPNERDTFIYRKLNYRWRTSYYWWAESFDDK